MMSLSIFTESDCYMTVGECSPAILTFVRHMLSSLSLLSHARAVEDVAGIAEISELLPSAPRDYNLIPSSMPGRFDDTNAHFCRMHRLD